VNGEAVEIQGYVIRLDGDHVHAGGGSLQVADDDKTAGADDYHRHIRLRDGCSGLDLVQRLHHGSRSSRWNESALGTATRKLMVEVGGNGDGERRGGELFKFRCHSA